MLLITDTIPDSFGTVFVVTFVDLLHQDNDGPTDPVLYISTLSNDLVSVHVYTEYWDDATWEVIMLQHDCIFLSSCDLGRQIEDTSIS